MPVVLRYKITSFRADDNHFDNVIDVGDGIEAAEAIGDGIQILESISTCLKALQLTILLGSFTL